MARMMKFEEEEPEKQEPCSAYNVNVCTSDVHVFARALANKIQLAIDDYTYSIIWICIIVKNNSQISLCYSRSDLGSKRDTQDRQNQLAKRRDAS